MKAALSAAQLPGGSAACAKAGAKVGSALPGKGTVIGFGVGLAIGIVVDWWMTEQFKEKMSHEMEVYIDGLKAAIVHGVGDEEGLSAALQDLTDDYNAAQREVLRHAIVEVG